MVLQSLAGLPAFLAYFCVSLVAVVVYLYLYTRITPHDEFELIRKNVPGAAVSLGLSLLGFALPVASAVAHAADIVDCIIWSLIALVRPDRRLLRRAHPGARSFARDRGWRDGAAIWLGLASLRRAC